MKLPTLDGGTTLLVGLDEAPPAPIQIGRPANGDFRGYEVDLLADLARRIGVQLRYRSSLWSVIFGELASGALDVVCSASTVTEERKGVVDFCRPHLSLTLAVVRRQDDTGGNDLQRCRVGVRRATTAEAYVRRDGTAVSLRISESNDELYRELREGVIDAVVDDSPIAGYFSRAVRGLRLASTLPGTDAVYAIMIRRGNDGLRHALDDTLTKMERDGTLQALRERWIDRDPFTKDSIL